MEVGPGSSILLESGTNEAEMLEFEINNEHYAVNVAKVKSILQFEQLHVTHLPPGGSRFEMLVGIHGKSEPLLCMHKVLGIPKLQDNDRKIVILLGFNNISVAILVDSVSKIHRINWNSFVPMNRFILANSSQVAIGTLRPEDHDIVVVDFEKIMTEYFPETNMEVELTKDIAHEDLKREDYKIIHVDDSLTVRKIFSKAMSNGGYAQLSSYTNGLEAYEALLPIANSIKAGKSKLSDHVHGMIIDIEMPKMDGLTLCRKIREEFGWNDILIIMFSSMIDQQMIEKCKQVGATTQIAKPGILEVSKLLDEHFKASN